MILGGNNLRRRQLLRGLHGTSSYVDVGNVSASAEGPFGLFCVPSRVNPVLPVPWQSCPCREELIQGFAVPVRGMTRDEDA